MRLVSGKTLSEKLLRMAFDEAEKAEAVHFTGGTVHVAKGGSIVAIGCAPGRDPRRDLRGRRCTDCDHWARRQCEPDYFYREECPCFECAGYALSTSGVLAFWEGRPKGFRFRVAKGQIK